MQGTPTEASPAERRQALKIYLALVLAALGSLALAASGYDRAIFAALGRMLAG